MKRVNHIISKVNTEFAARFAIALFLAFFILVNFLIK